MNDRLTTEVEQPPARVLLCGVERVGKSSWAAQSPTPFVVNYWDSIVYEQQDQDIVRRLMGMFELLGEAPTPYETVVIDTISALDLYMRRTRDRDEVVYTWVDILSALELLMARRRMGAILVSDVWLNPNATYPSPVYSLALDSEVAALIERWVDVTLFALPRYVPMGDESTPCEPVIYTQRTWAHPAGGRGIYSHLPSVLPMNYHSYSVAVREAARRSYDEYV